MGMFRQGWVVVVDMLTSVEPPKVLCNNLLMCGVKQQCGEIPSTIEVSYVLRGVHTYANIGNLTLVSKVNKCMKGLWCFHITTDFGYLLIPLSHQFHTACVTNFWDGLDRTVNIPKCSSQSVLRTVMCTKMLTSVHYTVASDLYTCFQEYCTKAFADSDRIQIASLSHDNSPLRTAVVSVHWVHQQLLYSMSVVLIHTCVLPASALDNQLHVCAFLR